MHSLPRLPHPNQQGRAAVFLLHFIEIILAMGFDICCAKLSEQMHLRNSICPCRFVIPSCFSEGQITFLSACSEKNLQDAQKLNRSWSYGQYNVLRCRSKKTAAPPPVGCGEVGRFVHQHFQMSLLYSSIVRSDEKKPAFAIFTSIICLHLSLSS